MNTRDYDQLSKSLSDYAQSIQTAKRPGYTTGSEDVLNNFKSVGKRLGLSAEQAWAVYFLKHIDAITTFMSKPDLPVSEAPIGRFADAINYLYLGYALFTERNDAKATAPINRVFLDGRDLGDETPGKYGHGV